MSLQMFWSSVHCEMNHLLPRAIIFLILKRPRRQKVFLLEGLFHYFHFSKKMSTFWNEWFGSWSTCCRMQNSNERCRWMKSPRPSPRCSKMSWGADVPQLLSWSFWSWKSLLMRSRFYLMWIQNVFVCVSMWDCALREQHRNKYDNQSGQLYQRGVGSKIQSRYYKDAPAGYFRETYPLHAPALPSLPSSRVR